MVIEDDLLKSHSGEEGNSGEFRQPWDTEGAPPHLGKDVEGLRVRVACCVLGVDLLKLFPIKNSINILFTCNHQ